MANTKIQCVITPYSLRPAYAEVPAFHCTGPRALWAPQGPFQLILRILYWNHRHTINILYLDIPSISCVNLWEWIQLTVRARQECTELNDLHHTPRILMQVCSRCRRRWLPDKWTKSLKSLMTTKMGNWAEKISETWCIAGMVIRRRAARLVCKGFQY